MRLSDMVEIVTNNTECVVLKVKDNMKMNLIALGCFDGDETMFRLTKGDTYTATIFSHDNSVTWYWGYKGYTLVSEKLTKCGLMIKSCIEEDFGIFVGKNSKEIERTLFIKTKEDKKNMGNNLKILYWPNREYEHCNIHKNGEHFKWFDNVPSARNYIKDNFEINSSAVTTAVTGCLVEEYQAVNK